VRSFLVATVLIALLCFSQLVGCAGQGDALRWFNGEHKTVTVDDLPYLVSWVRDASGIDMRGVRDEVILMPDEILERRRNTEAALIVGREVCGGKASVVSETRVGQSWYYTRVKCD